MTGIYGVCEHSKESKGRTLRKAIVIIIRSLKIGI